jgi:hypothetical protein
MEVRSMRLFRVWLIGASAALAVVSPASGDTAEEEAAAQQKKIAYECRQWASQHTQFDPKEPAPDDTPRRTGRLDPAPGTPGGALLKQQRRREDEIARKKQHEQEQADFEARRAKYDRALKTCLEGRGATPTAGK